MSPARHHTIYSGPEPVPYVDESASEDPRPGVGDGGGGPDFSDILSDDPGGAGTTLSGETVTLSAPIGDVVITAGSFRTNVNGIENIVSYGDGGSSTITVMRGQTDFTETPTVNGVPIAGGGEGSLQFQHSLDLQNVVSPTTFDELSGPQNIVWGNYNGYNFQTGAPEVSGSSVYTWNGTDELQFTAGMYAFSLSLTLEPGAGTVAPCTVALSLSGIDEAGTVGGSGHNLVVMPTVGQQSFLITGVIERLNLVGTPATIGITATDAVILDSATMTFASLAGSGAGAAAANVTLVVGTASVNSGNSTNVPWTVTSETGTAVNATNASADILLNDPGLYMAVLSLETIDPGTDVGATVRLLATGAAGSVQDLSIFPVYPNATNPTSMQVTDQIYLPAAVPATLRVTVDNSGGTATISLSSIRLMISKIA